jgi:hypothetical protein
MEQVRRSNFNYEVDWLLFQLFFYAYSYWQYIWSIMLIVLVDTMYNVYIKKDISLRKSRDKD